MPSLIALDPSSVAIGFATFDTRGKLSDCGSVTSASETPPRRVDALLTRLAAACPAITTPDSVVVMEVNEGRQHAWEAKRGQRSKITTATLCRAQGRIEQWVRGQGVPIELVSDSLWTKRGAYRTKDTRRAHVGMMFPERAATWQADTGGDAIDAVCLGLWMLARRAEAELETRPGVKVLRTRRIKTSTGE